MKRLLTIQGAVLMLLVFAACDNPLALGTRINISGPELKIVSPLPVYGDTDIAVGDLFLLSGTASTPDTISRLAIKLQYYDTQAGEITNAYGREWRYVNGWEWKKDEVSDWMPYGVSDYGEWEKPEKPVEAPYWRGTSEVSWGVPILLNSKPQALPSGDYFISITAWDSAGNSGAKSTQKIKANYDNKEPRFEVKSPTLLKSSANLTVPDYPKTGDDYTFDTYIYDPIFNPTATFSNIHLWVNEPIDFQWEVVNEMVGAYEMEFAFTDRVNLQDLIDGQTYNSYHRFEWSGAQGKLPQRGVFTDMETSDANFPMYYTKVGGAIDLEGNGNLPETKEYIPIQVISRLTNGSGVTETKSNGWFAWRPETNKPFVDLMFGYKVDPKTFKDNPNPNAPEQVYILLSRTDFYFRAYDDDGLASVSWKIEELEDIGLNTKKDNEGNDVVYTHTFTSAPKSGDKGFSPADYGPGRYKMTAWATDIKNVVGDEYEAYFTIESNETPTLRGVTTSLVTVDGGGQSISNPFGDTSGDFDISGFVLIRDSTDNAGANVLTVDEVKIVWIKPDSPDSTISQADYNIRTYAEWDKATNASNANGAYYEDARGNRVWTVPTAFDSDSDGNSFGIEQGIPNSGLEKWDFTKTLNFFTDLDIGKGAGKIPFGAQTFLVRAARHIDIGGSEKKPSPVVTVSTYNDPKSPELEVTKIIFTKSGEAPVTYIDEGSGYPMFPEIKIGDKIKISGTWTDDSLNAWSDLGASGLKPFFDGFKVTWEGGSDDLVLMPGTFDLSPSLAGTWETAEYTFAHNNSSAIIKITAFISDLQGGDDRIGKGEQTIIVETLNPTLVGISSDTSDGVYGEFKDIDEDYPGDRFIDIYLNFNNRVKFFDTDISLPTGTAPELVLNNGGRAYYSHNNGEARIVFRYFVNGANSPFVQTAGTSPVKGGSTPAGTDGKLKRLNVDGIDWGDYGPEKWLSISGSDTPVIIQETGIFNEANSRSLAGMKNIVIDKVAPTLSAIRTVASTNKPYSAGSSIYITVDFSEQVTVSGATASNFYLTPGGGTFPTSRAVFADSGTNTNFSFRYDIANGDNSPALTMNSLFMGAGLSVTDEAGNRLAQPDSLPGNGALGRTLVIDTTPPSAPTITGVAANSIHYNANGITFDIEGLEPAGSVEYTLNAGSSASWSTVNLVRGIAGDLTKARVSITLDGTYNIAARQYDNAIYPNVSPASGTVANVKLDRLTSPLLSRVSSSNADGYYGAGSVIDIELTFRIPVFPRGNNANTTVTLNTGGTANTAALIGLKSGTNNVAVFRYTVPSNSTFVGVLNVTGITISGTNTEGFFDANTGGTKLTSVMVAFNQASLENHRLSAQKSINILTGNPKLAGTGTPTPTPTPVTVELTTLNTGNNIGRWADSTGNYLDIRFDRNIYNGDTADKLVIKQVGGNTYRIPAVLTVDRYKDLFVNYVNDFAAALPGAWGDTAAKATRWQLLGTQLYERGSNGATVASGSGSTLVLTSDTTEKYVLKYAIDPAAVDGQTYPTITGTATMYEIKEAMREAEAIRIGPKDPQVSFHVGTTGSTENHILRITLPLNGTKALPVQGVSYEWSFPNGFVQDVLGNPNVNNSSANGILASASNSLITRSGLERPVIRINKGEDRDDMTGTGNNNIQARQPLSTGVKVTSRNSGASISYNYRSSTDNVGRLIMRDDNGTSTVTARLPNLGGQTYGNSGSIAAFNNAKNRPQSGNTPAPVGQDWSSGLNLWGGPGNMMTDPVTSTTDATFTIGDTNYNSGGMIYYIHAQVNDANDAYEAAYRSVLVFNNTTLNGNGHSETESISNKGNPNNIGLGFSHPELSRIWVRGGDKTGFDTDVPDFPISRDRSLYRKARLLTPINVGNNFSSINNATNATIDNSWIVSNYATSQASAYNDSGTLVSTTIGHGQYLWFWATWRLNVNAYIEIIAGELGQTTVGDGVYYPIELKDLYKGYVAFKEHYPVIPGRTTVLETRGVYDASVSGAQNEVRWGNVQYAATRRD